MSEQAKPEIPSKEAVRAKLELVTSWYEGEDNTDTIIEELCAQWVTGEVRIAALQQQLKTVLDQRDALTADLGQERRENTKLDALAGALHEEVAALTAENDALKYKVDDHVRGSQMLEAVIDELKSENAALTAERDAAQEQLVMAHDEMATVNALIVENAELKQQVERLESDVLRERSIGDNCRLDASRVGNELAAKVERLTRPVSGEELVPVIQTLSIYAREALLRTQWKDGIDIEEPNRNAHQLVDQVLAARKQEGSV